MKKIVYHCDDCDIEIDECMLNSVILYTNLESHKKLLCGLCASRCLRNFNEK